MLKTKLLKYTVIYTQEPEGGFTAVVPSLPGCVTYGENLNEAKEMTMDAIKLYVESLQSRKEKIPSDRDSFISSVDLEFPQVNT